MAFVIHANLDAEATWAGVSLPARVRQRLGATAALLAALAPDDARDVEIWAPAAVDPARLRALPGVAMPNMRVGTPPRADLAWADPGARDANSRRAMLAIAEQLGVALPGARAISSLAELDEHVASGGAFAHAGAELDSHLAQGGAAARWVCKAEHTAAGRDRAHGAGSAPPAGELRARIANLLARHGALVFEPWLDRIADAGACATIAGATALDVTLLPPHRLVTDARGGFTGIEIGADGLDPVERDRLTQVTAAVAAHLARTACYRGPIGVDAFAYRDASGARRFHPLCEINARYTFGAVAHALASRTGRRVLGFGPPPPGALVAVAPAAADPFAAWLA